MHFFMFPKETRFIAAIASPTRKIIKNGPMFLKGGKYATKLYITLYN